MKSEETADASLVTIQDWESQHFGIRMGRIHCDHNHISSETEAKSILQSAVQSARSQGVQHLTLTLNNDPGIFTDALSDLGFTFVDTKMSYLARPSATPRRAGFLKVRDYREKDRETVIRMISSAYIASRFSNDTTFPKTKIDEMYIKWLDKLYQEKHNNGILIVGERNGEIVGCGGLSPKDGEPGTLGNSMLVCSKEGTGVGYSITAHGINQGLRTFPLIEFSTSASNRKMIRVLESLSCAPASTSHIYTLFLKDSAPD